MSRRTTSKATGHVGEAIAANFLESLGYRIVDRNVRFPVGELDLVAWHSGTLVFVEVKTRRKQGATSALAAVHTAKQRRLIRAAELYLSKTGLSPAETRFDVVIIEGVGEETTCTLVSRAFEDFR
jgi:putative endonuclease